MAKSCIHCQKNKINRHTRAQIATYKEVDDRFSVIHVDIIGPFPTSEGKTYCLTCIDRFTCWIEVIPLANVTAETVAREFYDHWISHFGMPYSVITDQGSQFRSELFKNIGIICGFKVCTTTAYHPQCNGKIERIHRTLKAAIRAHNSIKWTQTLSTVLLGLRSALSGGTNYTIAQMVYGQPIKLPGEFFENSKSILDTDTFAKELQKQMQLLKPLDTRRHHSQKIFVHKDLHTCTHVFIRIDRVRKSLEPPYDGPFPVVKRHDKYFTVTIKGKDITISIDRLKPAYLLLTEVDVPHHKKLDTAPTLPNENLTAHQETENNNWICWTKMFRKKQHALIYSENDQKMKNNLWQKSSPSSTRYCRRIKFMFAKETLNVIKIEDKSIKEQVISMLPTKISINDIEVSLKPTLKFCMMDGKICNGVAGCELTQTCYLCGAKTSEMNDERIIMQKTVNRDLLSFGLSPLHT
ncbi:Retrovirus-related Pol polyprotein from transposon 412 [Araneus ventricosus]|uniref:Retrovirus-related Pol polyprotein from transposon 412 n=1 Tax=Araneus ventricosus TaxID=182803 RepID=A0A4Y2GE77_ARAVE|nr:Retrovirus-related Pol polyprotein from transposon 412 [Araneus ventricosus]